MHTRGSGGRLRPSLCALVFCYNINSRPPIRAISQASDFARSARSLSRYSRAGADRKWSNDIELLRTRSVCMWKYRRASCLWNDGQTSNSRCSILSVEWCNPAAGVNIGGALHSWPLLPQSAAPAGSSHLTTARRGCAKWATEKCESVKLFILLPRTFSSDSRVEVKLIQLQTRNVVRAQLRRKTIAHNGTWNWRLLLCREKFDSFCSASTFDRTSFLIIYAALGTDYCNYVINIQKHWRLIYPRQVLKANNEHLDQFNNIG